MKTKTRKLRWSSAGGKQTRSAREKRWTVQVPSWDLFSKKRFRGSIRQYGEHSASSEQEKTNPPGSCGNRSISVSFFSWDFSDFFFVFVFLRSGFKTPRLSLQTTRKVGVVLLRWLFAFTLP